MSLFTFNYGQEEPVTVHLLRRH